MARITCFDGVGCIGGNKILLEDGGTKLFFDFGRNFGAEGELYDEFMQPKPVTGLYEHVQMGFLPPIRDLYRPDLESSISDPWRGVDSIEVGDVDGVLVSHAHVDHIGSIGFLRPEIPIYCSPMSAAVSRALQDTGVSGQACEYCYYVPRVDSEDSGLSSPNYRTNPYLGRRLCLTDAPTEPFTAFWASSAGSRELEASECECASRCGGLNVRSFPVDHSVYGAAAWAVETSAGWVVYSGDLRVHGGYGGLTREFARAAAELEPVALIIEGTRIEEDKTFTESDVRDHSLDAVRESRGLVVADFGPRNVERLISFLRIARESGRQLAILPKDAYLLEAMGAAGGPQEVPSLDDGGFAIYWEYSGSGFKWQSGIRERYEHLAVRPTDVAANQDKFICCFSYWDINELAYIRPVPGSSYIYSSCEAFNEEMTIDIDKLGRWIERFGMKRYGSMKRSEAKDDPFHVSGHASRPHLMEIVRTISPKCVIPVHCVKPQVYMEELGSEFNVILPERGKPIEL